MTWLLRWKHFTPMRSNQAIEHERWKVFVFHHSKRSRRTSSPFALECLSVRSSTPWVHETLMFLTVWRDAVSTHSIGDYSWCHAEHQSIGQTTWLALGSPSLSFVISHCSSHHLHRDQHLQLVSCRCQSCSHLRNRSTQSSHLSTTARSRHVLDGTVVSEFYCVYHIVLLRCATLRPALGIRRPSPSSTDQSDAHILLSLSTMANEKYRTRALVAVLSCGFHWFLARRSTDVTRIDLFRSSVLHLFLHLWRSLDQLEREAGFLLSWLVPILSGNILHSASLLVSLCPMPSAVSRHESEVSTSSQCRQICQWFPSLHHQHSSTSEQY